MKAKGEGEWVVRGVYNQPDLINKESRGQAMSVSSKDNDVFVEFITGNGKAPVRLKPVNDNKLEGTVSDRRLKFEKVASKAGDDK